MSVVASVALKSAPPAGLCLQPPDRVSSLSSSSSLATFHHDDGSSSDTTLEAQLDVDLSRRNPFGNHFAASSRTGDPMGHDDDGIGQAEGHFVGFDEASLLLAEAVVNEVAAPILASSYDDLSDLTASEGPQVVKCSVMVGSTAPAVALGGGLVVPCQRPDDVRSSSNDDLMLLCCESGGHVMDQQQQHSLEDHEDQDVDDFDGLDLGSEDGNGSSSGSGNCGSSSRGDGIAVPLGEILEKLAEAEAQVEDRRRRQQQQQQQQQQGYCYDPQGFLMGCSIMNPRCSTAGTATLANGDKGDDDDDDADDDDDLIRLHPVVPVVGGELQHNHHQGQHHPCGGSMVLDLGDPESVQRHLSQLNDTGILSGGGFHGNHDHHDHHHDHDPDLDSGIFFGDGNVNGTVMTPPPSIEHVSKTLMAAAQSSSSMSSMSSMVMPTTATLDDLQVQSSPGSLVSSMMSPSNSSQSSPPILTSLASTMTSTASPTTTSSTAQSSPMAKALSVMLPPSPLTPSSMAPGSPPKAVSGGGTARATSSSSSSSAQQQQHHLQVCPVCSKAFSNASALAKHKLTHSEERRYLCNICSKAFKRQDHLNGHLLTHRSTKPFACQADGCGKSYCDARSLRRHRENHHPGLVLPPPSQALKGTQGVPAAQGPPRSSSSSLASSSSSLSSSSLSSSSPLGAASIGVPVPDPDKAGNIMPSSPQHQSPTPPGTDRKASMPTVVKPVDAVGVGLAKGAGGGKVGPAGAAVECGICGRKFKNVPALNGHMRLHGGYYKKDDHVKKSRPHLAGLLLQVEDPPRERPAEGSNVVVEVVAGIKRKLVLHDQGHHHHLLSKSSRSATTTAVTASMITDQIKACGVDVATLANTLASGSLSITPAVQTTTATATASSTNHQPEMARPASFHPSSATCRPSAAATLPVPRTTCSMLTTSSSSTLADAMVTNSGSTGGGTLTVLSLAAAAHQPDTGKLLANLEEFRQKVAASDRRRCLEDVKEFFEPSITADVSQRSLRIIKSLLSGCGPSLQITPATLTSCSSNSTSSSNGGGSNLRQPQSEAAAIASGSIQISPATTAQVISSSSPLSFRPLKRQSVEHGASGGAMHAGSLQGLVPHGVPLALLNPSLDISTTSGCRLQNPVVCTSAAAAAATPQFAATSWITSGSNSRNCDSNPADSPDKRRYHVLRVDPVADVSPKVGPQHQAVIPPMVNVQDRRQGDQDDDGAVGQELPLWSPDAASSLGEDELDRYLALASSCIVSGNSVNEEPALALLWEHGGDTRGALKELLRLKVAPQHQQPEPQQHQKRTRKVSPSNWCPEPRAKDDGAGWSRHWSEQEVDLFYEGLVKHQKDFGRISADVKTKSSKECVEFYYLWKNVCHEESRSFKNIYAAKGMSTAFMSAGQNVQDSLMQSPT